MKEFIHQINKVSPWILCILQLGVLGTGIINLSVFAIGCGAVGVLICLFRIRLVRLANESEELQKQHCKFAGIGLVLSALALCGLSAYQLLVYADKSASLVEIFVICAFVLMQVIVLTFSLIEKREGKSVATGVLRYCDIILLCILLALLVSRLLWLGKAAEWPQMICLTGCVLGGAIALLGCNMLLCSLCGYRTTKESIKTIQAFYRKKQRLFYYASVGKDGIMVLAKVIMSIASASFFMFANALFSCGIGAARYAALKMQGKERHEQLKLYSRVSAILSFAGLAYVSYSIRLFFGGTPRRYDMIMALIIALYTFVEFGVQIYDLRKLRKHHDIEAEALRLISLSSILISFVLTQTAIMSFTEPGEHTFSDGLSGVVFGGLVVLVGITSQFRCWHYKKCCD